MPPAVHCIGYDRHVKTFATVRGDHCYCGSDWDAKDKEALLAYQQVIRIIQRIHKGILTDAENKYLADLKHDYFANEAGQNASLLLEVQAALRNGFVKEWAKRFKLRPDDDQAAAIATGWRDTIVEARAGSGKSRTIIARTLFLIDNCGLAPDSILILAFNNRAADELKSRLRTYNLPSPPHVMTFHALARRVVEPEEEIIFNAADDPLDREQRQSRVIDGIIRDFVSIGRNEERVRELLRYRFAHDETRVAEELLYDTKPDAIEHRKRQPLLTLASETVKSYGEQQIANVLFSHNVDYRYESAFPIRLDGAVYRPDFTIPAIHKGKTVIIEYFGMTGIKDYDCLSEAKRRFWKEQNGSRYAFLEYGPNDVEKGPHFAQQLIDDLTALGVPNERLSSDEIWKKMVEKDAILDISRALASFVQQARKCGWDTDMAREAVFRHTFLDGIQGDLERSFYDLALDVFDVYLDKLAANNQIDFDELLDRALRMVEAGKTTFCGTREDEGGNLALIRAVLVDEFQDFNSQFDALLGAARKQMSNPTLFAVGDPWQAINSFAGASTEYFTSFTQRYVGAAQHVITTNYRSSQAVVEVGNRIMADRPGRPARVNSAKSGKVRLFDGSTVPVETTTAPSSDNTGPYTSLGLRTKARLVAAAITRVPDDKQLFVLSRTDRAVQNVDRALKNHLSKEQRDRIMFATVHQSKGLEAEYVVLLDGGPNMFPLVHPNWIFSRIFGANIPDIERDEQNLLYVAITRAATETWVLLPQGEASQFLPPTSSVDGFTHGDWSVVPPLSAVRKTRIAVDGFAQKGQLWSLGFRFESATKRWVMHVDSYLAAVDVLRKIDPHKQVRATVTNTNSGAEQHFYWKNWPTN